MVMTEQDTNGESIAPGAIDAHRSPLAPAPPVRVGLRVRGRAGLVVRRPTGSGDYVVVRFLEAARFGARTVEAGSCLFLAPDTPTTISAGPGGIFNDFAHLAPALVETDGLALSSLPIGVPFPLPDHCPLAEMLTRLQAEWNGQEPFWETALRLATQELLLVLARAVHAAPQNEGDEATPTVPHVAALRATRRHVHADLSHPWTVPEMARQTGLRPSRFSALYRQLFGASPADDLIAARMELARYYLTNHPFPIGDVATLCGFASAYHFSRCFRRRMGVTPSAFRRGTS